MINRGGDLHLPAMPQSYLESWHQIIWPKVLKVHGGDRNKGSILDKKVITTNSKLERIKQFGPSWSWMALAEVHKEAFWASEANPDAP